MSISKNKIGKRRFLFAVLNVTAVQISYSRNENFREYFFVSRDTYIVLLCIFRGGAVELKNLFFILAKNEWTASPLNSAKSLEIRGFSAHTKPIKIWSAAH